MQIIAASHVQVHPGYDASNSLNDLALVWLSQDAPTKAERFSLYRNQDELGQTFTMVGYGVPGLGSTGVISNFAQVPVRVVAPAANVIEPSDSVLRATKSVAS